jgi:hypothetical protein
VWVIHEKALNASWEEIVQTVTGCLSQAKHRFAKGGGGSRSPNPQSAGPKSTGTPGKPSTP